MQIGRLVFDRIGWRNPTVEHTDPWWDFQKFIGCDCRMLQIKSLLIQWECRECHKQPEATPKQRQDLIRMINAGEVYVELTPEEHAELGLGDK
jgi:hypothetical protein